MAGEREYSREEFEREVEEALREAGAHELPPPPPPRQRPTSPALDLRPGSPGQVLIAGLILIVLDWFGLTHLFGLGGLASTIGLLLLLFGGLSWLFRPRRRESYWRGRRIEWDEGAPTWLEKLYYTFYRR